MKAQAQRQATSSGRRAWLERRRLGAWLSGMALLPGLARAQATDVPGAADVGSAAVGAREAGAREVRSTKAAPEPVAIALPGCTRPPYDAVELRDTLALELSRRQLHDGSSPDLPPLAVLRVELSSCDPDADHLILFAADTSGALVLVRRVALREVAFDARARTLALLVAESLSARARTNAAAEPLEELTVDAISADDTSGEPPTAEEPLLDEPARVAPANEPLTKPAAPIHLGLGFQLRSPLRSWATFWGAQLSADGPLWSSLAWAAEADLMSRSSDTALGELQAQWWSASLGVDVTRRGRLVLAVGPRVTLAHVSVHGENRFGVQSLTQSENLVLLGGRGSVGVTLGRGWQAATWLEMQRALRGLVLTAGGEPTLLLDGWIAATGLRVGRALE